MAAGFVTFVWRRGGGGRDTITSGLSKKKKIALFFSYKHNKAEESV